MSLLDVRQVSATNYPGFHSVKRGEHLIEAGPEPSTLRGVSLAMPIASAWFGQKACTFIAIFAVLYPLMFSKRSAGD
jgi:hypothetical protein